MSTLKRNIKVFGRGFIEGFSSLFDLYPEENEIVTRGRYDDYEAIKSDWENVGRDIEKSIKQFDKEHKPKSRVSA